MSRTDESGRDGLREAVERLVREMREDARLTRGTLGGLAIQQDADALDRILADHPPTPAEEPAEVVVEVAVRERLWRQHGLRPAQAANIARDLLASDWLRDHDAALTAKAKADAWDEGERAGRGGGPGHGIVPNPYRSAP